MVAALAGLEVVIAGGAVYTAWVTPFRTSAKF